MEITYLILLILVFVFGIMYIRSNGGIRDHIYFSYALAVYFLFFVIPGYFYWKLETFEELGVSIKSVFANGIQYYLIGMSCFVFGYTVSPARNDRGSLIRAGLPLSDKVLVRMTLFFIILTAGIYIGSGFMDNSYLIYVWSTLDCLITLIIALYIRKIERRQFFILTGLAVFIFSIYFFRYRIYLTMMGIGAVYVYHNPDIFRKIWKYAFIGLLMFYVILFFTINRNVLAERSFDQIQYNVFNKEEGGSVQNIFIQQASNLHADFTVLKYYFENSDAPHDYGETMFLYPFIRAVPASFFTNNTKPYPAPAMQLIIDAYGGDSRAAGAGRFVTNLFEFYIAFGLVGLILGMFIFGLVLRVLQDKWYWDRGYNSILQIAIMVSLFQYISRGYLPQYLNHITYLTAPVFILMWLSGKVPIYQSGEFNSSDQSDHDTVNL